jgi:hypothetical protein
VDWQVALATVVVQFQVAFMLVAAAGRSPQPEESTVQEHND